MIRYVGPRTLDNGLSSLIQKEQHAEDTKLCSTNAAQDKHNWANKTNHLLLDNMKGFIVHEVVPQVSPCGDYVEYVFVMENSRSGTTWDIKRRYSLFHDLRDDLEELFETPHCHYCKKAVEQLQALSFPPKRLFHSDETILQRVEEFHAYIQATLKILSNPFYRSCSLVSVQAHSLIKRFLLTGMRRHDVIECKQHHAMYSVPLLLRELQLHANGKRLEPIVEQPSLSLAKAC
ncbi:hypothetical protein H257_13500 [Aphanomyces astaci]|uniref:PX domain-containing protein n=1 Tax=Aphanomyces astaci TaxID=112090 RepID=W4FW04_APHAT|nr:hypothetical protein H257_13500 [Aphanomyces astaci]ETV71096.1 hypothetical protein H257_13500 [Aphanomyces astaci]KAF0749893.1 hypothetical protein AaE_006894 [Aphanomyces astaci]RHY12217.1 hypothetical protein DYB36_002029 [Aphanomyces astaci]RHY24851.1 hypothetical protein DYB25_001223 [Aphanomyces astaci]RHY48916.1 hypothetical protein DYB30_005364 [Aphanomyces astaci]|eukprot:XP_009839342.1 hypothetical protein H257_13500 [Aphanomyces astaci]